MPSIGPGSCPSVFRASCTRRICDWLPIARLPLDALVSVALSGFFMELSCPFVEPSWLFISPVLFGWPALFEVPPVWPGPVLSVWARAGVTANPQMAPAVMISRTLRLMSRCMRSPPCLGSSYEVGYAVFEEHQMCHAVHVRCGTRLGSRRGDSEAPARHPYPVTAMPRYERGLMPPGRQRGGPPHGFQNPCDGMRNARLKREEAFSQAMIMVSSAMVSSS